MDEDFVNFVKNAHAAQNHEKKLEEAHNHLKAQLAHDIQKLRKEEFEEHPLMVMILDVLSKKLEKYEIQNLQDENVPLYITPSILMSPANGEALQTVAAVNSLSSAVLKENNNIDTTDLIKTLSTTPLETFTEFATTVTTFGILRMTRIMIQVSSILLDLQLKMS